MCIRDRLYSGTVSAAREGTFRGISSIAISIDGDSNIDYSPAKDISKNIVQSVLKNGLPNDTLLNVTIPNIPKEEMRGIKITKQGSMYFIDNFEKVGNSRGLESYWLTANQYDPDMSKDNDSVAVKEGFISITPLHSEQTNFSFIEKLTKWSLN